MVPRSNKTTTKLTTSLRTKPTATSATKPTKKSASESTRRRTPSRTSTRNPIDSPEPTALRNIERQASRRLPLVAVLVFPPLAVFETAVACEVFGLDRRDMGVPMYRVELCTPGAPMRLRSKPGGFDAYVEHDLQILRKADLIICPGWSNSFDTPIPEEVVRELRRAHRRGAWLASFCSGAHVLAGAGLLHNRRASTHWMHVKGLAVAHPTVQFDSDVLYVDDDSGIFTSAGTAAAIDLSLHIMRKRHGAEVANVIARRMVMPAHRTGGQAQYIASPAEFRAEPDHHGDPIAESQSWATAHLSKTITVEALARRAHMSARTYARRFRDSTGTTPLQWLLHQRVFEAQRLLESTGLPIERIADRVGLGSAANLRVHFGRVVGISPLQYRQTFHTGAA